MTAWWTAAREELPVLLRSYKMMQLPIQCSWWTRELQLWAFLRWCLPGGLLLPGNWNSRRGMKSSEGCDYFGIESSGSKDKHASEFGYCCSTHSLSTRPSSPCYAYMSMQLSSNGQKSDSKGQCCQSRGAPCRLAPLAAEEGPFAHPFSMRGDQNFWLQLWKLLCRLNIYYDMLPSNDQIALNMQEIKYTTGCRKQGETVEK